MKFEVKKVNRNISNDELLADVKNIASKYSFTTMSQAVYAQYGKYNPCTLIRRFGSWFNVLELCALKPSRSRINIPNEELFENLEQIWLALGRQPKYSEIVKPSSLFSVGTYEQRFGSWYNALDAFVQYMSNAESYTEPIVEINNNGNKHFTKREPNARLKVQVLMRDGNRCRLCGVECNDGLHNIHFDHIIPWSKGGETVLENLQVLCNDCNLAKGNIE